MAFYIVKRILLMIPTLMGVMVITFTITQFVPGGPVERMIGELEGVGAGGEVGTGSPSIYRGNSGLDSEKIDRLKSFMVLISHR